MGIYFIDLNINKYLYRQVYEQTKFLMKSVNSEKEKVKPIQLISFDSSKQLKVNTEAIQLLTSFNQKCRNLAIITVVGKYRTGKSYILNRVLLQQNSGFQVGPTINACTKGLWIWPIPIKISEGEQGTYGIVMDTQGLGSLEQGENADTKIFLMALLLSSYFIYNSVGSIDEKAIQNLSLVINLSKLLHKGSSKDVEDILNSFPSFLWLVRDFALRLEDQKGKPLTPTQYLQNAMKLQKGKSDLIDRKNNIRKQLMKFFKQRDCFMLIRPISEESQLQKLATLKDSDLRPQFLELVDQLRKKIFSQIKRKTFKGKPCSPLMFIQMCQFFCEAINKGDLPQIQSNWQLVCKSQANRISASCQIQFQKLIKKYESTPIKDINLDTFQKDVQLKMTDLLKHMQKNIFGDKQKFKKQLKKKFKKKYEDLKQNIEKEKNRELEGQFYQLQEKLKEQTSTNKVKNVFEIVQEYDKLIQMHANKTNKDTLSIIHKKSYEGLKGVLIDYFVHNNNLHKHQYSMVVEKIKMFEGAYNTLKADSDAKKEEAQIKQRELKNKIYALEFRAKESADELTKTKALLESFKKASQQNQNQNSSIPLSPRYALKSYNY